MSLENGEVEFGAALVLVAVAFTESPPLTVVGTDAENVALPDPSVVTVVDPRNVLPCCSATGFEKNSMVRFCEGNVVATLPAIVVDDASDSEEVNVGAACGGGIV